MRSSFVIACFALHLLAAPGVFAQCGLNEKQIGSASATSSVVANSLKREGSIRVQSDLLIDSALARLRDPAAAGPCPPQCPAAKAMQIRFSSVPKVFLNDYRDRSKCDGYLVQTRKSPLVFGAQQFALREKMMEWISGFSQGQGPEGAVLYQQCDGSCSPQYTYFIKFLDNQELSLTPQVACGPARDTSDNMYALDAWLQYSCTEK